MTLAGSPEAQTWSLVKGSPEAIGALLESRPAGYDATYRRMAERGMRILALAVKPMPAFAPGAEPLRESAESTLRFVGFVAFECLTRSDTALVVGQLLAGAVSVAMVTGDASLTALHVAREASPAVVPSRPCTPVVVPLRLCTPLHISPLSATIT